MFFYFYFYFFNNFHVDYLFGVQTSNKKDYTRIGAFILIYIRYNTDFCYPNLLWNLLEHGLLTSSATSEHSSSLQVTQCSCSPFFFFSIGTF